MRSGLSLDQGAPSASADPAHDWALAQALPLARGRRARVRALEARVGATSVARPWSWSGSAPCRP